MRFKVGAMLVMCHWDVLELDQLSRQGKRSNSCRKQRNQAAAYSRLIGGPNAGVWPPFHRIGCALNGLPTGRGDACCLDLPLFRLDSAELVLAHTNSHNEPNWPEFARYTKKMTTTTT